MRGTDPESVSAQAKPFPRVTCLSQVFVFDFEAREVPCGLCTLWDNAR